MENILNWLQANETKILLLACILAVALVASKLVSRGLKRLLSHSNIPNASIFVNFSLVAIWTIAAAMVLEPVFGINPTTLVTALGVGGVAISLGLKDTIANIVAGFGLMIGQVIHPGDKISISGISGTVEDITWRQTVVRERNGNQLVIPNSQLNTSSLEHLTELCEAGVTVAFTVRPGSDLRLVTKRALAATKAATKGMVIRSEPPLIRFTGFSVTGIDASVTVFAAPGINPDNVRDSTVRALAREDFIA